MVIRLTQVVYADILLIVNTYVNYMLLRLSAVICKNRFSTIRLCLASALGSLYSFIILYDIPNFITAISRIAFAAVMILIAFKIPSFKDFLRLFAVFFCVNFAFAGIMFAVWNFICPQQMYYNNTIVYFNINALSLFVLTALCYALIKAVTTIAGFKTPSDTIYEIEIKIENTEFSCRGFLDTGNSLKEPFSSFPVIIAYEKITDSSGMQIHTLFEKHSDTLRVIPYNAIKSPGILKAIKPERVTLKKGRTVYILTDVYIALTDQKIHQGDFGALFGKDVFNFAEKKEEKNYAKQN